MATIIPTGSWIARGVHKTTWGTLSTGDKTGGPATSPQMADKTVFVDGVYGTGTTIIIEGSSDGVTYHLLHDPQGNDLSFTSGAAPETILENPLFIRPRITAGASAALDVTMIEKGGG